MSLWPPASYVGCRPFCFTAVDLSCLRRLISKVAWPIVTNFATCSMVTQIYKIRSEVWVGPSPHEIWQPKNVKFWRNFAQLRDLIVNISGTQHDFVNRKTALQTTDTPAQANLIRCTLVHKRRKIGPEF